MKINISDPIAGTQTRFELSENKQLNLFDKKIGDIIQGDCIDNDYKGRFLLISGGQDKQGFFMRRGIMDTERIKLKIPLHKKGNKKKYKSIGFSKKRSVRGSIISSESASLNLVLLPSKKMTKEAYQNSSESMSYKKKNLQNFFIVNKNKFRKLIFLLFKFKKRLGSQSLVNAFSGGNTPTNSFFSKFDYIRIKNNPKISLIRKNRSIKKAKIAKVKQTTKHGQHNKNIYLKY